MKAIWSNKVIAESENTIFIEGNHYFPRESVNQEYLISSPSNTTCAWKGEASYYDVVVDGQTNKDAAWYYPSPTPTSLKIIKQDYTNYVAFWKGVEVVP